jgi:hypothetical protein
MVTGVMVTGVMVTGAMVTGAMVTRVMVADSQMEAVRKTVSGAKHAPLAYAGLVLIIS